MTLCDSTGAEITSTTYAYDNEGRLAAAINGAFMEDYNTGFYYYGYRHYSPIFHCFLNRDPIEEEGGLNLYAFCGNDAVNKWDLLGMKALYRIHVIGDSLPFGTRTVTDPFNQKSGAGHNDIKNQGWRGYLKIKLDTYGATKGFAFEFVGGNGLEDGNIPHDGHPGAKTGVINNKIKVGKIVCSSEDDIYMLLIGMNDALKGGTAILEGGKANIPEFRGHLDSIAKAINDNNPVLFLLGEVPYVTDKLKERSRRYSPPHSRTIIKYLNREIHDVASKV